MADKMTDWSWWGGPAREVDESGTYWWDAPTKERLLNGALQEVDEGEEFRIIEARSWDREPPEHKMDHDPFARCRNGERYRKENGVAVRIDA